MTHRSFLFLNSPKMASFKARLKLGSTRRWSSSKQMNNANIKNSVTDRNEIESRWVFFLFSFFYFRQQNKKRVRAVREPINYRVYANELIMQNAHAKRERERAKAKRVGTGVVGATHPSYRVLPSFPLSIREAQLFYRVLPSFPLSIREAQLFYLVLPSFLLSIRGAQLFYRVSLVQKGEPVGVYLVLPSFS